MARIHLYGMETGGAAGTNLGFTNAYPDALATTSPRSGSYNVDVTSLASGVAKAYNLANFFPGEAWFRFYLNVATRPSANNRIVTFGALATARAYIILNNAGQLQLYNAGGALGSLSSALTNGQWYRVEVHLKRVSTNNDTAELYIDGTLSFSSTTTTITGTFANMIVGGNLASEAQTTGHWYFDDLSIDGSAFPGPGRIINLQPNAAGDNTQWGGTTGTWTDVDEVPPGASDILTSKTSGQISDFNLTNTPSDINTESTIIAVAPSVFAAGASTTAVASFVVRIKATSGGTVEESIVLTPNITGYRWDNAIAGGDPITYPLLILSDLPGASTSPWTKALLDTAQIGVRCSTSNTNNVNIASLWLTVEYVNRGMVASTGTFTETGNAAKFAIGRLGNCTVSGTATATAAGHVSFKGTATITATATATAAGKPKFAGAGSISATATSSAAAKAKFKDTATISGTATGAAAGHANFKDTATISATATTAASSKPKFAGAGSISGTATTTAAAKPKFAGAATVSGSATTSASSKPKFAGAASISGTATTAAAAAKILKSACSISGTATASAHASPIFAGLCSISATATSAATGEKSLFGIVTVNGTASANALAIKFVTDTGTISATAAASSVATRVAYCFGSISGTAAINAAPAGLFASAASVSGTATTSADSFRIQHPTVTISGTANSAAAGAGIFSDTFSVSGTANASAHGAAILSGSCSAIGTAITTGDGFVQSAGQSSATISGTANATANAVAKLAGAFAVSATAISENLLAALRKRKSNGVVSGSASTSAHGAALFSDSASITATATTHARSKGILQDSASVTATATSAASARKKLRALAATQGTADIALTAIMKRACHAAITGNSDIDAVSAMATRYMGASVYGSATTSCTVLLQVPLVIVDLVQIPGAFDSLQITKAFNSNSVETFYSQKPNAEFQSEG